jgi:EpsI family protein
LAFLLGVFANGLRIALIGMWTFYFKGSSIHGPFSTLYSSSVFLVEACALIFIAIAIGKRNIRKRFIQDTPKKINGIDLTPSRLHSKGIIIGMIVFLVTGSYLYVYAPTPALLKKDLKEIPLVLGSWRGKDVKSLGEDFERVFPDSELKRTYYDQVGNSINFYVGYFASQRQNREVVNYRYDWLHNNSQVIRVSLNPHGDLEINKTRYYRDKNMKFAYFWYYVDGKIMTDRYSTKLETLMSAFLKKRTNGALVVVSFEDNHGGGAEDSQNAQIQFLKMIFPILQTYFSDNQNSKKNL